MGDWGCNSNTTAIVNNIIDRKIQLVIGLGDFSYRPTADCWLNMIHPIENITKIVIGNHEDFTYGAIKRQNGNTVPYTNRDPSLLNQYLKHFGLTKEYYSFNYHNIHFLVLASYLPPSESDQQAGFVQRDLEGASTNPSINWIVVCFHHPIYTSPGFIDAHRTFRDFYQPLFDRYGVDLVLEGHNHNYQRSYPLEYNSSNSITLQPLGDHGGEPLITSTEKYNYTNPRGEIYVIVGTGGKDHLV